MFYNVSHIPEGGDYKAQKYQLTQMYNRSLNYDNKKISKLNDEIF